MVEENDVASDGKEAKKTIELESLEKNTCGDW